MSEFFADTIIWVILYPLWLFLIIGAARFFAIKMSNKVVAILTLLGSFTGLVFSLGALPLVFSESVSSEQVFTFINIQKFMLQLGLSLDKLAIVSLSLLYFVSFLVQLFSVDYLAKEPKFYRFFAFLNLFNFAMAIIFIAPNLFQFYIGWELIGLVSYLFIGFKYVSILKSKAALKVFIINRLGDVAFLAGIISLLYIMLNYAPTRFTTLDFSDLNLISTLTYGHTGEQIFFLICLLFLIASSVKSAQFPFNSWLLSAMEAATPVSALIHSATLVVAGVFLLLRLAPLLSLSPVIMHTITVLGILTAIYCSLCAIAQDKVKSVLAYSTSAHIGLMFVAIGLGRLDLALLYMIIHGIVKAALFLSYGAANNEYEDSQNTVLTPSFLVGALVLSGLLFVGVNIKELFYIAFQENQLLALEYLLVVFLGAVYILKISILKFSLKESISSKKQLLAVWTLFVPLLFGSFLFKMQSLGLPFVLSIVAVFITFIACKYIKFYPNNFVTVIKEGFFIDKFLTRSSKFAFDSITNILKNIELALENSCILKIILVFVVNFSAFVERYIFQYPIRLVVACVKFASKEFELVQTKNIQTYIAYGALIIGVIFTTILLTYSLIIHIRGGMG